MTDAHCHVSCGDPSVREFLIGRDFVGIHPWESGEAESLPLLNKDEISSRIRQRLIANPDTGVGEIGLDRLKQKEISQTMREVFVAQLELALELGRPVVLHGAKCWGQVVKTIRQTFEHSNIRAIEHSNIQTFKHSNIQTFPSLLFHGFSRSDGLIPDIVRLNGYISVGPAVLNDHAVNYRELIKKIPLERLLVETDRTPENAATCPSVRDVAAKVAELRGLPLAELESLTDRNADEFISMVPGSLAFARSAQDGRIERQTLDTRDDGTSGKKERQLISTREGGASEEKERQLISTREDGASGKKERQLSST